MTAKAAAGFTLRTHKGIERGGGLLPALGAALLLAGIAGQVCSAMGMPVDGLLLLAGMAAAVCAAALTGRRDRLALLPLGVLLAAAVFCAVFHTAVGDSLLGLVNRYLAQRQSREAVVYVPYACNEVSAMWAGIPISVAVGTALGMLAARAPRWGLGVYGALLCLTLWSGVGGEWLLPALCGSAVLLPAGEGDKRALRARWGGAAQVLIASVIVTAAVALLFSESVPRTEDAANALRRGVHRLRYESAEQVLPEGDLRALGARSASDADMLRVTMSEPMSAYLRGYVGQRYTSDGWREADAADMTANSEVLYQLHRDGYDSFSQLSTLAELLGQEAADVRMDIRVLGACRSTRLTPYGLDSGEAVISPEQLRDTVPNADGTTGEKEYSFTAKSGLAAQAYALLGQLNDRWQEEALADYLTFEGYYRDFVYENYLTIPEETQKALTAYLGDAPEVITSYEAKRRIVNCLDDTLTYSETPESVDSEKDFVSALLADDPGGYDVHYATAAAVMLRYYGIPARYVEGYLITPQAVEGRTGETTLTLTGRDAHAWVEYYEDGVGWIPFEPTPGYRDVMEEPQWLWFEEDENAQLDGSAAENGGDNLSQTTRRSDVEETEPEEDRDGLETIADAVYNYFSRLHLGPVWWAYVAAWLLAAALAVLLVRRAVVCRRRERLFAREDDRAAAAAMCAYALELAWCSGAVRRNVPLAQQRDELQSWAGDVLDAGELLDINDRALYGGSGVTAEQRETAEEDMTAALELFRRKCGFWKRLYQRWIRCLY